MAYQEYVPSQAYLSKPCASPALRYDASICIASGWQLWVPWHLAGAMVGVGTIHGGKSTFVLMFAVLPISADCEAFFWHISISHLSNVPDVVLFGNNAKGDR